MFTESFCGLKTFEKNLIKYIHFQVKHMLYNFSGKHRLSATRMIFGNHLFQIRSIEVSIDFGR